MQEAREGDVRVKGTGVEELRMLKVTTTTKLMMMMREVMIGVRRMTTMRE